MSFSFDVNFYLWLTTVTILLLGNFSELHYHLQKQINIQGHRGARGLFPENTVSGFVKAVGSGADTLELDIVVSADRQVVVSHEAWMNENICSLPDGRPVEPGKGKEYNLYRMTYEEIKKFDCGRRGHPEFPMQAAAPSYKPLLSEVITAIENYTGANKYFPVSYNIEIKSEEGTNLFNPPPAEFVNLVLSEISKHQV